MNYIYICFSNIICTLKYKDILLGIYIFTLEYKDADIPSELLREKEIVEIAEYFVLYKQITPLFEY